MHLYILRHANADTEAATDAGRELSEKGREQAKKVAHFCTHHGITIDVIFSSSLIRAQQTAKPVAKELGVEITTVRWLACGATPEGILRELSALKEVSSVMLVGHQPDLGELIAHLTGMGSGGSVNVRKASLTLLEVLALRKGGGRLEFSIPARMM
ncbi:MAG: phosphohistidine phosphatase SixA [Chthoniobacteraceae bacterium]